MPTVIGFGSLLDALQRRKAMRELRSLTNHEFDDQQWVFKNAMADAHEALDRDLRQRALEIWVPVAARFPDLAMTSPLAFDLLLKLQRYEDAETLLTRGLKKYKRGEHFLEGLALIAYKRGEWEEAVTRCQKLRKQHPGSLKAYWIAAAALSELGRADEAEAILSRGIHARTDDVGLRIEYARLAERRGDWEVALDRWGEVAGNFGHLAGVIGRAKILTNFGRFDEANSALSEVLYKTGNEIGIWIAYAEVSEARQNLEESAERWATVQRRFPLHYIGYLRGAQILVKLDRHAEAEAILREGIERIPHEASLAIEYAQIAHREGRWADAAQRWASLRDLFPKCPEGYHYGRQALNALGALDEAAAIQFDTCADV